MVVITATQKPDDNVSYSTELISYNSESDLFTIKIKTNDPEKTPIIVIMDKEEIKCMTNGGHIKQAYEFSKILSEGNIPVLEWGDTDFSLNLRKNMSGFIEENYEVINTLDSFVSVYDCLSKGYRIDKHSDGCRLYTVTIYKFSTFQSLYYDSVRYQDRITQNISNAIDKYRRQTDGFAHRIF